MTRYVLTKIFHAIITFVLSGIVIFFGVRMLPGDPALAMAGEEATPERLDAIRTDLGLDQPLLVQFVKFLGDIVTGDLGESTRTGLAVTEMIATTLPVTLWLSLYAIVVAVIVGITLGMVAERFRGKRPELGSNFLALLGLSARAAGPTSDLAVPPESAATVARARARARACAHGCAHVHVRGPRRGGPSHCCHAEQSATRVYRRRGREGDVRRLRA